MVRAPPTVVLPPPLKLLPDTSSYVVMPAIVTPNTRAAATTGRRHPLTLARQTVPRVNSPTGGAAGTPGTATAALDGTAASRSCSPVRRKKCWNSVPPQVATTLTTPAPRIVP
ncbi:hypothetical protein ACWC24_33425 [Streptomyces sp. NPDC001443]